MKTVSVHLYCSLTNNEAMDPVKKKKIPLRDLQDGKASDHQMKVKIS